MIRIDRKAIDAIKAALERCIATATTSSGLKIMEIPQKDEDLERAALLAMYSLTVDNFGTHEVCVPENVTHFVDNAWLPNAFSGEERQA